MQSNIFIVSAAYLIFLDKEIAKKKFLPAGGSRLFFISPCQWIGSKQLFKAGLEKKTILSFSQRNVQFLI